MGGEEGRRGSPRARPSWKVVEGRSGGKKCVRRHLECREARVEHLHL